MASPTPVPGWAPGIAGAFSDAAEQVLGTTTAQRLGSGMRMAGTRLAGLAKPGPWMAGLPVAALAVGASALGSAGSEEPTPAKVGDMVGSGAGSLIGTAVGSAFGPVGSVVGGIGGGLIGSGIGSSLGRGFEAPEDREKRLLDVQLAKQQREFEQRLGQSRQELALGLEMKRKDLEIMEPARDRALVAARGMQAFQNSEQAKLTMLAGLLNSNAAIDAGNMARTVAAAGMGV